MSVALSSIRILIATATSRSRSQPRYTVPSPPRPAGSSTTNRSSRTSPGVSAGGVIDGGMRGPTILRSAGRRATAIAMPLGGASSRERQDHGLAVEPGGGQPVLVGAERRAPPRRGGRVEPEQLLARARIPHPHERILAGGHQQLAAGGERGADDDR